MARVIRKTNKEVADRLKVALNELDGLELKTGFFETAKYEDGTPVAYVAAIHEFGSSVRGIPARPFFRPTIVTKKEKWAQLAKSGSRAILAGNEDGFTFLEKLGLQTSGDIAKTISQVTTPPLKESTIKAKQAKMVDGSVRGNLSKPLIETGIMINSLTYGVSKK